MTPLEHAEQIKRLLSEHVKNIAQALGDALKAGLAGDRSSGISPKAEASYVALHTAIESLAQRCAAAEAKQWKETSMDEQHERETKPALRRILRVQRLLYELGFSDVVAALEAFKKLRAARSHQEWNPNEWSDERIDNMAELIIKGMPDGISGFCRTWGWRQFARALIEICKLPPPAQPVEAPQREGGAG